MIIKSSKKGQTHIVPINTRVINHHIYKHSYTPCYTCCEENVVSNVYDGCPNQF